MTSTARIPSFPSIHARLSETFASGKTRPLAFRLAQLRFLRRALADTEEAALAALAADLGRSRVESLVVDLAVIHLELSYFLENLPRLTRPVTHPTSPGETHAHEHVPRGVCLQIVPYNVPIQVAFRALIGAIAAGNCVVVKPSELTPESEKYIVDVCERALDPDAFAVVTGGKEAASALLVIKWDHITYTGGGRVGRIVAAAAARNLTPIILELGGQNPAFVMKDADLTESVKMISYGRWVNNGQICMSPNYALIDEAVYDSFVEEMREVLGQWYGDNPKASPAVQRMVNKSHFNRVCGLLERTEGKILIGGESDEADLYIAPTVVELTFEQLVSSNDSLMSEEIFGPVLLVVKMSDINNAINFVKSQEKALTLYVFSNSTKAVRAVVDETDSGMVGVNICLANAVNAAGHLGGVGESGVGGYGFHKSFESYSHVRQVTTWGTSLMRLVGPFLYQSSWLDKEGKDSASTEKFLRFYMDIPGAGDNGVGPLTKFKRKVILSALSLTAVGVAVASQKLSSEAWRTLLIAQASLVAAAPLSMLARWQWRFARSIWKELRNMFTSSS